jgi:hypothetical protein
MPKRTTHRRRNHHRRTQKGGAGAAEWMTQLVGNGNQQFQDVFGSGSSGSSNTIKPLSQSGGRSRHRRGTKKQRGGYWAEVLNTAAVPLALFGLQRKFANRSRKH